MRVQFITCDRVKDTYGVTSGLFNSATFVRNYLNSIGIESALTPVVDSNGIDKIVTDYNPDVVIIEALWCPPGKFEELLKIPRHKNRRWIIRIHSKAPFLANEGLATKWIIQYANLGLEIAPNTEELTQQFESSLPFGKFTYLPNIYYADPFRKGTKENQDFDYIDIGCFGAIRPMKNTYQQALAAIDFANGLDKKLRFHVNSSRVEQNGNNVLKNLEALFEYSEHELVHHKWYKHKDFLEAVSQMDMCMQVSFSESFNIVTADSVTAKVPVVCSEDISWMPRIMRVRPTSHKRIVRKIRIAYLLNTPVVFMQSLSLKYYNYKAKKCWVKNLKG
jgi:hypothetical protein